MASDQLVGRSGASKSCAEEELCQVVVTLNRCQHHVICHLNIFPIHSVYNKLIFFLLKSQFNSTRALL